MSSVPENLAAAFAKPVLINPTESPGRDSIFDFFFADFGQFAAAFHAARRRRFQVEFRQDQVKLLEACEGGRNPERFDLSLRDGPPIEEKAIGSDDNPAKLDRVLDQVLIADVLNPNCFATRSPEPPSQSTQPGVAN